MKIKLTKLKELPNALNPNNIPEGFEIIREVNESRFQIPTLNQRFWLGSYFSTSGVQEIIDDNTFRTYSSIYKWEII